MRLACGCFWGHRGSGGVYHRNLDDSVYPFWNPKGHDIVCLKSPAEDLATGNVEGPPADYSTREALVCKKVQ